LPNKKPLIAPILLYCGLMLAWSLWLGWAWKCFSAGGLWRPLRWRRGSGDDARQQSDNP
jgi:hypothetical protein